jgi:hypothetical protein
MLNKILCSYKEKLSHTWARLEYTPHKSLDINGPILYAETINSDSHVRLTLPQLSKAPKPIGT